jgi:prepilin-type N-terminal cleavage/methylation domain-containing protein
MEMRKNFKKGFTLVEMMIVVAIIAILAGVAIPKFMGNIRKTETTEAVGLMRAIIDAQNSYQGSHDGKFYPGAASSPTMINTLRVLNVALPTSEFNFEMQVNTEQNVTLIRAYSNDGGTITASTATTPFIYMFAPREGGPLLAPTYDADIWNNTVNTIDYINDDGVTINYAFTGSTTWIK